MIGTLSKVRKFYLNFRRISHAVNYKYISRETFVSLLESFKIFCPVTMFYDLDYKGKDRLNIFQILAILIWTSFSDRFSKLKCNCLLLIVAFALFDFNNDATISYDELCVFFVATCRGLARLSKTPLPKKKDLQCVVGGLFYLYDANDNNSLELKEIWNWMNSCEELSLFLDRYEPKNKIVIKNAVFKNFPSINITFEDKTLNTKEGIRYSTKYITTVVNNKDKPKRFQFIYKQVYSRNNKKLTEVKGLCIKLAKVIKHNNTKFHYSNSTMSLENCASNNNYGSVSKKCQSGVYNIYQKSYMKPSPSFPSMNLCFSKSELKKIPYKHLKIKSVPSLEIKNFLPNETKRSFRIREFIQKMQQPNVYKIIYKIDKRSIKK